MKREELFRFPNKGPVSITTKDGDRTLVFSSLDNTASLSSGFDAAVSLCASEDFYLRVEVAEPLFLAEKIKEHWWDRIVFSVSNARGDNLNDSVKGPFSVSPCVRDQELWLWCRRNP